METKGKTLEEIDEIFDGEKHTQAPDVAAVVKGKLDPEMLHGLPVTDDNVGATTVTAGGKGFNA